MAANDGQIESGSAAYLFGTGDAELDRLVTQAEVLGPFSNRMLVEAGVPANGQAIDLGCGCLGILHLLAERVGPGGAVVGLDREPRMLEVAREQVQRRRLANVELVQADAARTGLSGGAFDLVHCRALLCNTPHTDAILTEMVRLARPGAVVAAADPDLSDWFCEPGHPAWNALIATFRQATIAGGTDVSFGRQLTRRLRAAGLLEVGLRVDEMVTGPGHPYQVLLPMLIENLRASIVAAGLRSPDELDSLVLALRDHLEGPGTITGSVMLWQAWGRRPA
jgi:ubiquinone/menaquinone biosynthesis C-methylase UbiE